MKRSDIVRLLDMIEDANGPRAADLALAYLRRIFSWHATRDDDFRSPIIKGMGRYDIAANARSRVLDDDELRTLWKARRPPLSSCTENVIAKTRLRFDDGERGF